MNVPDDVREAIEAAIDDAVDSVNPRAKSDAALSALEAAGFEVNRKGTLEALEAIAAGRIDLQFDETTDRPMWHVAFVQLQSIARAILTKGEV